MKCPGWRSLLNCLVRRFACPARALHRPGSFVPAREGVLRLRPQGRVGRRQHPDLSGDAAGTLMHGRAKGSRVWSVGFSSVAGVLVSLHKKTLTGYRTKAGGEHRQQEEAQEPASKLDYMFVDSASRALCYCLCFNLPSFDIPRWRLPSGTPSFVSTSTLVLPPPHARPPLSLKTKARVMLAKSNLPNVLFCLRARIPSVRRRRDLKPFNLFTTLLDPHLYKFPIFSLKINRFSHLFVRRAFLYF